MVPKPHRVLLDRVSGYADEAAAFLRRRRLDRAPFARVQLPGGRVQAIDPQSRAGEALFAAAADVIAACEPRD